VRFAAILERSQEPSAHPFSIAEVNFVNRSGRHRETAMWSCIAVNGIGAVGVLVSWMIERDGRGWLLGSDFLTIFQIFAGGMVLAGALGPLAWLHAITAAQTGRFAQILGRFVTFIQFAALFVALMLCVAGVGMTAIVASRVK
jgi:hypothetical protein